MTKPMDLIAELEWRGLLKDVTDREGLRAHLADPVNSPRRIYAGFDPTADSLTIGNLVTIMALAHAKRAGHEAVVVMGGGTGLIGDPSGKSSERTLMTRERVLGYVEAQRPIYAAVLGGEACRGGPPHRLLNNLDWLGGLSYIDALRDIGKHFSVNMMMQKESVKERLHNREQGISYTEFSYMILQAYDFLHLFREEGVTVQFGGSDQFGNIVAGMDLILRLDNAKRELGELRRHLTALDSPDVADKRDVVLYELLPEVERRLGNKDEESAKGRETFIGATSAVYVQMMEINPASQYKTVIATLERFERFVGLGVFGLTWPLVTKADGGKFGKTETGAVWLTADRTSPYAYYQFWLNATDADAVNWLKVFTFLPQDEISAIVAAHEADPGKREAQRRLAREATTILHGAAATEQAEAAGKALFSGEMAHLDEATLREVFAHVPSSEHSLERLGGGADPLDLLVETGLAASRREGREFLANGSVTINGRKITPLERLGTTDLLHGSLIAIRRGKKQWHLTKWV